MGSLIKLNNAEVIEAYKNIGNSKKIAKAFGVSPGVILRILKENNIFCDSDRRKYSFNDRYFQTIDSHEKAYFLGFIFADGCVRKRKKGDELIIKIHKDDIETLEHFKVAIQSNHPINISANCREIRLCNSSIVDDLINLGCVPRKSLILEYPKNLSKDYESSFILGYFDGDGTVGKYGNNRTASMLGTKDFLSTVQEILTGIGIKSRLYTYSYMSVYNLAVIGKDNLKRLEVFLYQNNMKISLSRKKDKFKLF